jgi:hypothetical protein
MRIASTLVAVSLTAAVSAQLRLDAFPVAPVGYYGWTAAATSHQFYFDLTVANTVTLQALETLIASPVGQQGELQMWVTNPGITTHVGNELTAANWTQVSSGVVTGNGTAGSLATLTRVSCQEALAGGGHVLLPGTYGIAIRCVNVTPLFPATAVSQTYSNADLTISGGTVQYTGFVSALPAPPTAAGFNFWGFRGSILYAVGSQPHACAEANPYGEGCYKVSGSFYREFTDPVAASSAAAALNNRSIQLVPSGGGYLLLPSTATYIAPTPAATALPTNDDGESPVTLTTAFPYPGGSAPQLFVHTNGYVSVASQTTLPGGFNFVPDPTTMLNAPSTAWWSWHDYNTAEAGSGTIKFEEVGPLVLITWDGVESYPTTAVNPSTWQFQFDTSTGVVSYVWQTIDPVGGSGFLEGDDHLVGFSPGGNSPNAGPTDITTLVSQVLTIPEQFPLTLTAPMRPLLGSTVSLDTSNEVGFNVGLNFVALTQIPAPGFDLGIIGAAGCPALIDVATGIGNVISNLGLPGTTMSVSFAVPNSPAFNGLDIYSQSVWLAPGVNPFGAITSNGVTLTLGIF